MQDLQSRSVFQHHLNTRLAILYQEHMRKIATALILFVLVFVYLAGCIDFSRTDTNSTPSNKPSGVDFTWSPQNPSMVNWIQFKSNLGEGYHYWDFGDGTRSAKDAPMHRYLKSGEFNVTLKIYNPDSGNNFSCTKKMCVAERETSVLPNKWAIMCVKWRCDGSQGYAYKDYAKTRQTIVEKLGFPEDHIFDFENEFFNKDNIIKALNTIKSSDACWENATIVICLFAHGSESLAGGTICTSGGRVSHSFLVDHPQNLPPAQPSNIILWDYELKEILDNYTLASQKVLVVISACESGCFAAQDTSGILHGETDSLYTSCGGPNRIIISITTAPLDGFWKVFQQHFWVEGLGEGKGDTNPINGNNDGKTSIEEAWFYCKTCEDPFMQAMQPCMNDQYPAENPEGEMFL